MGTNTDTKLIEISPYMHQIGHSLNSREITRNVQEGRRVTRHRKGGGYYSETSGGGHTQRTSLNYVSYFQIPCRAWLKGGPQVW